MQPHGNCHRHAGWAAGQLENEIKQRQRELDFLESVNTLSLATSGGPDKGGASSMSADLRDREQAERELGRLKLQYAELSADLKSPKTTQYARSGVKHR